MQPEAPPYPAHPESPRRWSGALRTLRRAVRGTRKDRRSLTNDPPRRGSRECPLLVVQDSFWPYYGSMAPFLIFAFVVLVVVGRVRLALARAKVSAASSMDVAGRVKCVIGYRRGDGSIWTKTSFKLL